MLDHQTMRESGATGMGRAEVSKDGQDAAMAILGLREVELEEDMADVCPSTVRSLTTRRRAIAGLLGPCAISLTACVDTGGQRLEASVR
jgi:hypothetical protein